MVGITNRFIFKPNDSMCSNKKNPTSYKLNKVDIMPVPLKVHWRGERMNQKSFQQSWKLGWLPYSLCRGDGSGEVSLLIKQATSNNRVRIALTHPLEEATAIIKDKLWAKSMQSALYGLCLPRDGLSDCPPLSYNQLPQDCHFKRILPVWNVWLSVGKAKVSCWSQPKLP